MLTQVSEAKKEVRDRTYEEEMEHSAAGELQSRADVMKADCATQLRAADALQAAIKQHNAASDVLARAKSLEDTAAGKNVVTVALQQQVDAAKSKVLNSCIVLVVCELAVQHSICSTGTVLSADVFYHSQISLRDTN